MDTVVKSLKCLFILFSCTMLRDNMITWYMMWWLSPTYSLSNTDMLLLDTWYLTLDISHRYLTCYYLTPDTWYLIFDTGIWHVITWHLILHTWYLTPVLDMLLFDTWYLTLDIWHRYLTCYHLTLIWHLISDTGTWHVITWHLTPVLDILDT